MKCFLAILMVCLPCFANTLPIARQAPFFSAHAAITGGGGGGSAWVVVAHNIADMGASGGTTTTYDTTGCTGALFVAVHYFNSTGATPLSDNKGNTWTLVKNAGSGSYFTSLYKCASPTVGTGHTFSTTANLSVLSWIGFSGGAGGVIDGTPTGANTSSPSTTLQPGSITPTTSADLFVTALTYNGTLPSSVNSSFTLTDKLQEGGNNLFGAIAYKIKTDAAAENPTWTIPSNDTMTAVMGAVK